MRKTKILLILIMVMLASFQTTQAYCQPEESEQPWNKEQMVRAEVLRVEDKPAPELESSVPMETKEKLITVKLLTSEYKGQVITLPYAVMDQPGYDIEINPGDELIVSINPDDDSLNAYITDYARDKKLLYLTIAFVAFLVVFGGLKGIKSVISLAITGAAVFFVLLPLMLEGYNPIMLTILVSAAVTAITLFMIAGISIKSLAAIIGTTGGVLVAGILALLVGHAAQLTGFSSEEMYMLLYIPQQIDFDYKGLLFAGMIIGALGAVMDVGMSVASAIEEVKKVNPNLGPAALTRAGMNVGRDIMGTMANTLILAYTGGAIPLILVFMAYRLDIIA